MDYQTAAKCNEFRYRTTTQFLSQSDHNPLGIYSKRLPIILHPSTVLTELAMFVLWEKKFLDGHGVYLTCSSLKTFKRGHEVSSES